MAARIDRRLTTVLSADVAGYSALMERDEDATLLRLRDFRGRLIRVAEHHRGRIVNTAGDGVLAEFPSAVDAVRAAIDVQRELGPRNEALPSAQRMHFRIGINAGDVMTENGDLFGEGVNVAARLQQLAAPGGILISGPVHDLVHAKLEIAYEFIGAQRVKNIESEVPVYRVHLEGESTRPRAKRARPEDEGQPRRDPAAEPAITPAARTRAARAGVTALVLGVMALVMGEMWMGLVTAAVLWLGLSHAGLALAIPGRQRTAIEILLLIGLLASINLLTGPSDWWFLYPAAPLFALAALFGAGLFGRST